VQLAIVTHMNDVIFAECLHLMDTLQGIVTALKEFTRKQWSIAYL